MADSVAVNGLNVNLLFTHMQLNTDTVILRVIFLALIFLIYGPQN